VYGFPLERCLEALQATAGLAEEEDGQPSLAEAVDWLLSHGEADNGGPAMTTQLCCHLQGLLLPSDVLLSKRCAVPGCSSHSLEDAELWLCAHCGYVACGRYAARHAQKHNEENEKHCVALSLGCLAAWCYECNSYVKHKRVDRLVARLEALKFGPSPASSNTEPLEPVSAASEETQRLPLEVAFCYSRSAALSDIGLPPARRRRKAWSARPGRRRP
ncbi:unnamed protein product, partial [Polarella glacialis]